MSFVSYLVRFPLPLSARSGQFIHHKFAFDEPLRSFRNFRIHSTVKNKNKNFSYLNENRVEWIKTLSLIHRNLQNNTNYTKHLPDQLLACV
jgi:hypothetical protein